MSAAEAVQRPQYANYWESDTTANPVIVRIDHFDKASEHQNVILSTTGEHKQVHIHELGRPHYAY